MMKKTSSAYEWLKTEMQSASNKQAFPMIRGLLQHTEALLQSGEISQDEANDVLQLALTAYQVAVNDLPRLVRWSVEGWFLISGILERILILWSLIKNTTLTKTSKTQDE